MGYAKLQPISDKEYGIVRNALLIFMVTVVAIVLLGTIAITDSVATVREQTPAECVNSYTGQNYGEATMVELSVYPTDALAKLLRTNENVINDCFERWER